MNEIVPFAQQNWNVVFRAEDQTVILYNPSLHRVRALVPQYSVSNSSLWASSHYFDILEEMFLRLNDAYSSLNDFLLDGYFDKFFPFREKIGSGGFSSVYHVRHQLAGIVLADYAVKVVPFGEFSRLRRALSEVKFLSRLSTPSHPLILSYYHCWVENWQPAIIGPKVPCLFILMEYSKIGNLESYLQKTPNLPYHARWQIFLNIALALQHLHQFGVIHRDLKLSNILVFKEDGNNPLPYRFVLSDFGTSTEASNQNGYPSERTGATGTIETMAPELLEQSSDGRYIHHHSFQSDIWSLGVIFCTLFYGVNPFKERNGEQLLRSFSSINDLIENCKIPINKSPHEVYDLMKLMLRKNPSQRISINELLNNQIVKSYIKSLGIEHLLSSDKARNNDLNDLNQKTVFKRSIPITFDGNKNKNKRIYAKNWIKMILRNKFQMLLLISAACFVINPMYIRMIHFAFSLILTISSAKNPFVMFLFPLYFGIIYLLFPNNSFFLVVLSLFVAVLFCLNK